MTNLTKDDGDETAAKKESEKAEASSTESQARKAALAAKSAETPESPVAPPVQTKSEGPSLESPEAPAAPPEVLAEPPVEDLVFGDVQSGGIRSGGTGLATYVSANAAGSASTGTSVDTGVGSAPFDRPTTFSLSTAGLTTPAPATAGDFGTGAQMANRANTFDPPITVTVYIDPGAF